MSDGKGGVLRGFREFILRGNVIDLAVAVVIGAAFTAIVTSIVANVITPLIGALFNASSLDKALIVEIPTVSGGEPAKLLFGAALASILNFLIVAAVVYFAIILPVNHVTKLAFAKKKVQDEEPLPADVPPTEAEILTEIRDLLARQADAAIPTTTGKHAVITPETPAS